MFECKHGTLKHGACVELIGEPNLGNWFISRQGSDVAACVNVACCGVQWQ
uniref:Uncharacterized protein n=1 Tax=Setaria italica TaxID=4555 RepID=K3Z1Y2_SETIT